MARARAPSALASAFLLLAAAAGTLAVAGAAVAQIEECGPLGLAPDARERTVSGDEDATITLDVSNGGALGGTAWVNASGAPGWSTAVEPGRFSLDARETRQVDVVATPTNADEEASPFELSLQVELDCSVSEVTTAGSAAARETIDLELQDDGSGALGGMAGPAMSGPGMGYVLVGAVAVLSVVGYPVVRRRTRAAARLEARRPSQATSPGKGISFETVVTNTGGRPGTIHLELEDVPQGWSGFLARSSVDLEAGESRTVDVLLRTVDEETATREATVRVRARPGGRERGSDDAELTVLLTRA